MKGEQIILQKIENIEKDLENIKQHMVNIDGIMTEEDYEALLEYRKEKAEGKLISHKTVKKELQV